MTKHDLTKGGGWDHGRNRRIRAGRTHGGSEKTARCAKAGLIRSYGLASIIATRHAGDTTRSNPVRQRLDQIDDRLIANLLSDLKLR